MDKLITVSLAALLVIAVLFGASAEKRGYDRCKAEQAVIDATTYATMLERINDAGIDPTDVAAATALLRSLAGQ